MSEDKGFSYESPEKKKRSAAKLFTIEIGVLIFVAISIIGLLIYLKVIQIPAPILNILPSQVQNLIPQNANSEFRISAVSDIPGYTVKINDPDKLIEILNQWTIFGAEHKGVYYAEGNTYGTPVRDVVIHLTNVQKGANKYSTPEGEVYLASHTVISPGRLDVYAYLGDQYFNSEERKGEAGLAVASMALHAFYQLDNHLLSQEARRARADATLEVIGKILQENPNLIEVQSN